MFETGIPTLKETQKLVYLARGEYCGKDGSLAFINSPKTVVIREVSEFVVDVSEARCIGDCNHPHYCGNIYFDRENLKFVIKWEK